MRGEGSTTIMKRGSRRERERGRDGRTVWGVVVWGVSKESDTGEA